MSLAIASKLSSMSESDSPFDVAEVLMSKFRTSAESLFAASSNVDRVLVLGSKKRFATVLPRNKGTFLIERSPTSINESAVSSIAVRISLLRPDIDRKCFRLP